MLLWDNIIILSSILGVFCNRDVEVRFNQSLIVIDSGFIVFSLQRISSVAMMPASK